MQPFLPHLPAQNVPVPIGLSPVIPKKPSSGLACVFVLILVLASQQPSCKGSAARLGMALLQPPFDMFLSQSLTLSLLIPARGL